MIPRATIDEIMTTSVIEEVIGDFIALKKRGVNWIGSCPFHQEKTGSFTVSPVKSIYKCFGCGEGGNVVSFIMAHEQLEYPQALKYLGKKYNIEIPEREMSQQEINRQGLRESLMVVTEFANNAFQKMLWETNEGKQIGVTYFKERGYSDFTIKEFQLGYCPLGGSVFTDAAVRRGYDLQKLISTGLTKHRNDRTYDGYRGRVIFPIHNMSGNVIGFGGRILKDSKKFPKYVNSPESDLYSKTKTLYGISQARKSIIKDNLCYMVEGYTDVLSFSQSGVTNVVASSGTSLTVDQVRIIRRMCDEMIIVYDGDMAGVKASMRGIDIILQQGIGVKLVLLEEGEDPDSLAKKLDPKELKKYLKENAKDFLIFKAEMLMKEVGNDIGKKAKATSELLLSISLIPDQVAKSLYIRECGRIMRVEEHHLLSELKKLESGDIPAEKGQEFEVNTPVAHFYEMSLMSMLINHGDVDIIVEDEEGGDAMITIGEFIIYCLNEDDISMESESCVKFAKEYSDRLDQVKKVDTNYFSSHMDKEIQELAIHLLGDGISTIETIPDIKAVNATLQAYRLHRINGMIKDINEKILKAIEEKRSDQTLFDKMRDLYAIKRELIK